MRGEAPVPAGAERRDPERTEQLLPRVPGEVEQRVDVGDRHLLRSGGDLDDLVTLLRRPTLLGAILIKACWLMVHRDPDAQREDLLLLQLSLADDPRAMAAELRKSERGWLRKAEPRVKFERTLPDRRGGAAARSSRVPTAAG
jgi:hypothetical protein